MGLGQQRTEAKCNLSTADVIFQMRSTRWKAFPSHDKHSAPHLSLRQSQPCVWALQSKSLPVLLLYRGLYICLCTLECISWLLGLGCSGVHSQAVKTCLSFQESLRGSSGRLWKLNSFHTFSVQRSSSGHHRCPWPHQLEFQWNFPEPESF